MATSPNPTTSLERVRAVSRALLAGQWWSEEGSSIPIAPLLLQAALAFALCALVKGELPPYSYGIFALSIPLTPAPQRSHTFTSKSTLETFIFWWRPISWICTSLTSCKFSSSYHVHFIAQS